MNTNVSFRLFILNHGRENHRFTRCQSSLVVEAPEMSCCTVHLSAQFFPVVFPALTLYGFAPSLYFLV